PFGEPLRANGSMAFLNPFRFSNKFQDDETKLLYYGYRSYNPITGKWLSRDPMEERGGLNTYSTAFNCWPNYTDRLGKKTITLVFGFDARATKAQAQPVIAQNLAFLEKKLIYCVQQTDCGCQQTEGNTIKVRALYEENSR